MPETRSIGVYDGHPVDKESIDQEQVLAFAANGKPLYIARAGAGATLTDPVWQIRKMFYDDATGVTLGYAFANSSNLYQFLPANYASYTYISPSVTSASFGNNYTVTLTTSTTSTADVFNPSDGYYSICIFGTWTGAVSLERYHATLQPSWQVVNSFTQNIQTIGTHAGSSGWQYRLEFTTATSGTVSGVLTQA